MIHMEPINDNGPRPDDLYEIPQTRRRRIWPIIVAFMFGGLIFFGLLSIVTFSVIGMRSQVTVNAVELTAEPARRQGAFSESIPANLQDLRLITGSGPAVSLDNINRLVIDVRNGATTIGVHDESDIWINNHSLAHNVDEGTLTLKSRNEAMIILIPHSDQTALFEEILITGRNGSITIAGVEDGNTLIAENMTINNRNGRIMLYNLAISNALNLETRNGNINLHNILSNPYDTRLFSRNGRVITSE